MPSPSTPSARQGARALRSATALTLAAALAAVGGAGAPLAAPTARTSFGVGAVVLAHAGIAQQALPEALELSAEDVARGFVDRPAAVRLSIVNTSAAGFALEVLPVSPVISGVEVGGAGAQAAFDAGGGSIIARGIRGRAIELSLGFRFQLAPGLAPGRYPWPLAFNVRPLGADQ
jgi:hypothetical protein